MRDTRHESGRPALARQLLAAGLALLVAGAPSALGQPALTFTEFQHPEFGAFGPAIVNGPDGALWLTDGDGIFRLSTAGHWLHYPLPPDGQSYPHGRGILGLAVGPDHAVWFTESVAGRIGRIAPDGAITEFPLPAGRTPEHITSGPDGALWYTEFAHRIGRITLSGEVTEFVLPPCAPSCTNHPGGITTGPDGAIWFTNLGDSSIWRMTTGGALTRYGPFVVQVGLITAGPDGALWFTGPDTAGPNDHIGRITTAGTMTAFPLPIYPRPTFNGYNNLGPSAITTGPDGALWFTASRVNLIGRITTGGVVSYHELPPAADTTDVWVTRSITTGPDNALWVANRDGTAGVVVRAALSTVPVSVTLDVRPGSCRNPLNPAARGVLPVAIVGTEGLDADAIDVTTIRLNGVAPLRWSLDDAATSDCAVAGGDGYRDLVLMFRSPAVAGTLEAAPRSSAHVTVTGTLKPEYGGTAFIGVDTVTLVGRR